MYNQSKVFMFINVNKEILKKVADWSNENNFENPCILVPSYGELTKDIDINIDIYNNLDCIPTNSEIEEAIYEDVYQFKDKISKKVALTIDKINIFPDAFTYLSIPFEYIVSFYKSIELLLKKHSAVFLCVPFDAYHMNSISYLAFTNKLSKIKNPLCFDHEKKVFKEIEHKEFNLLNEISIKKLFLYKFFNKNIILSNFDNCIMQYLKEEVPKNKISKKKSPLFYVSTGYDLYRKNFIQIHKHLSKKIKKINIISHEELKQDNKLYGINPFYFNKEKISKFYFLKILTSIYFFSKRTQKMKENNIYSTILSFVLKNKFFIDSLIPYIVSVISLRDTIDNSNPSYILKDCTVTPYDNILFSIGNKKKIPIIGCVYASISEKRRNFSIYYLHYVTILGENQRQILIDKGYKNNQIISVGQPELDEVLQKWTYKSSLSFLKKEIKGFNKNIKTILIATSAFDRKNEIDWIKILIKNFSCRDDIQIILKPHPSALNYYSLLKNTKNFFIADSQLPIYPFIQTSDIVLTDVSHSGKLAVFFNKKLIVVNISGKNFPYQNFDEEGVAYFASSSEDLIKTICKLLDKNFDSFDLCKKYDLFVKNNFTRKNGKTCERIHLFLKSVTNKELLNE
jgi:hypothetical protein